MVDDDLDRDQAEVQLLCARWKKNRYEWRRSRRCRRSRARCEENLNGPDEFVDKLSRARAPAPHTQRTKNHEHYRKVARRYAPDCGSVSGRREQEQSGGRWHCHPSLIPMGLGQMLSRNQRQQPAAIFGDTGGTESDQHYQRPDRGNAMANSAAAGKNPACRHRNRGTYNSDGEL